MINNNANVDGISNLKNIKFG